MPRLEINYCNKTIKAIEYDSIYDAIDFVQELPDDNNRTFVYVTVNEKTRIENTVILKKKI